MTENNKADLLKNWLKAKKAEQKAQENRYAVEEELLKIYGTDFDGKSSKTFKEDDLGFSINIKKNVAYSFDQDAWGSIRADIPADLRPEKIKFEVDVKGFEFLKDKDNQASNPGYADYYLKISDCVTIKDNKTTVKVEKI